MNEWVLSPFLRNMGKGVWVPVWSIEGADVLALGEHDYLVVVTGPDGDHSGMSLPHTSLARAMEAAERELIRITGGGKCTRF